MPHRRVFCVGCLLLGVLLSGCEESAEVTFLAWSPDGRLIGYIMERDIIVQDAGGRKPPRKLASSVRTAEDRFSWAPDGRFIVYASQHKGSWDLWMVSIETGKRQQLTKHLAKDWGPTVSPDGTSVLFLSDRGRQIDVWKLDLTTREMKKVTHDALEEYNLRFARVPHQFVYLARRNPVPPKPDASLPPVELHRVDLTDDSNRVLAQFPSRETTVELRRDGELLAVMTGGTVSVMSAGRHKEGKIAASYGSPRELINLVEQMDWLGDTTSIIYAQGLNVMSSSTRRLRRRPRKVLSMPTTVSMAKVSPDGRQFAVVVSVPPGRLEFRPQPAVLVSDLKGRRRTWLGTTAQLATAALLSSDLKRFDEEKRILLHIRNSVGESAEPALTRELARVETRLGNYDDAVTLYREHLNDPGAAGRIAFFFMRDYDMARKLLARAPDSDDDVYLKVLQLNNPKLNEAVAWAERYLIEENYKQAVKYRLRVMQRYPESPLRRRYAFEVAELNDTRLHNARSALKQYVSAASGFPESAEVSQSLLKAGDLCRFKLKRPDRAIGYYRQARTRARDDVQRIAACVRQIDFYLNLEPATDKALDVVRDFCKNPPEEQAMQIRAVVEMVNSFDRLQQHDQGNKALAELVKAFQVNASDLGELISVPHLDRDRFIGQVLLHADFASLPSWFLKRIDVLSPHVDEEDRFIADLFGVLKCTDLAAITAFRERYLRKHGARLEALAGKKEAGRMVEALFHYLIGTHLQTRGEVRKALSHYAALCRIDAELGSERFAAYAYVLDYYRRLPAAEDKALRAYMAVEREAAASFWGDIVSLGRSLQHEQGPLPAAHGVLTRDGEVPRQLYLSFIKRFPKSVLNTDARYRLAEFSRGTERLKWYEFALSNGPQSLFFHRALEDYIDAAVSLGHAWRATQTCQDLSATLTDPERLAAVRLRNGKLCEEHLSRSDLALPLYDRVADGSPRLGPWAQAQHRAGLIEFARKDYAKALRRFTRLREERPDYPWVGTGECLYYIGRCNESLANAEDALKAYLELIDRCRKNPRVANGTLLLEIFGRTDEATRRQLYDKHPEDIRKIMPRLDAWEREKLLRLIPELRR